jgi:hypothetical protein
MTMHAFAPVFLIGLLLVGAAALLPDRQRPALVSNIERLENKTALPVLLLAALFLYWLARLLFFPSTFFQLIRG